MDLTTYFREFPGRLVRSTKILIGTRRRILVVEFNKILEPSRETEKLVQEVYYRKVITTRLDTPENTFK